MEDAETGLDDRIDAACEPAPSGGPRNRSSGGICLQVLAREPHQPDALHLLGIMERRPVVWMWRPICSDEASRCDLTSRWLGVTWDAYWSIWPIRRKRWLRTIT